jgi:hypothetical protein
VGTLDAGCVVAGSLDRFQKNPAFVGTNVGVGSIVDSLDQGLQAVPPDNALILALKLGVSAIEAARNTVATPYNFVCQQVKRQGTYYEMLPLDEMVEDIGDRWNQMSLTEKAVTVAIGVAIVETVVVLALPK